MHWIQKWRDEFGMSHGRMAILVGCGSKLLDMIEHGAITHPNFANRIADLCGATAEQRDGLVHEKHRGKWKPNEGRTEKLQAYAKAMAGGRKPQRTARAGRAVVKIDREGNVLERYPSIADATAANGNKEGFAQLRCSRKTGPTVDEFFPYGYSYRYAADWDMMGREQRLADIAGQRPRPRALGERKGGTGFDAKHYTRPVACIDRQGNVIARYDSVHAAARAQGREVSTIRRRCKGQGKWPHGEFAAMGCSFRYADEWDRLTPEQRRAELKGGHKPD